MRNIPFTRLLTATLVLILLQDTLGLPSSLEEKDCETDL